MPLEPYLIRVKGMVVGARGVIDWVQIEVVYPCGIFACEAGGLPEILTHHLVQALRVLPT
jgi:hypothetical protein